MKIIILILVGLLSGCAHISVPLTGGHCPAEFPIKGNADSFIYHTRASMFYGRTKAEICFASEEAAYRHGYRPARF